MSVLITVKINGDTDVFRTTVAERGEEMVKIADAGKAAGAIHHRFAVGDGFVLVVDEWESPEQFEKFFSAPELHEFIASAGGDPSQQPEITVAEAIESPDTF